MSSGTPTSFIKLSDLTAQVSKAFEQVFGTRTYWVLAEISNSNLQQQKGHWYFECVEKSSGKTDIISRIACVAWKSGVERIRVFEKTTGQAFQNGIEVLLKVSVEYHPVYGLKLCMQDIDVQYTIGALELQKQKTIERLLKECSSFIRKEGENFITTNNQLPLPMVIQDIAVISSKSAAGYEDFKFTLASNSFNYRFNIDSYYTYVQGEANSAAVYGKLLEVFKSGKKYDVVVIIRGGGSQTDFLIFDQFDLGKIVAKFPIPIITGIGHQKNQTIVDLLAHTSTTAPTKAAEFIIAQNRRFDIELDAFKRKIIIRSQQRIAMKLREVNLINHVFTIQVPAILTAQNKMIANLSSGILNKPRLLISNHQKDLALMSRQLGSFSSGLLKNQQGSLAHFLTVFKMMSPLNIMKKGFALVKINGKIITDPEQITVGKDISIILSGTEIRSEVISKNKYHGNEFDI